MADSAGASVGQLFDSLVIRIEIILSGTSLRQKRLLKSLSDTTKPGVVVALLG